jgi:hypothetical protein
MNCEICGREVQGNLEAEEVNIGGVIFPALKESIKKDWLLCKFCNILVCEDCCLNPESGYCNRHLHYYYNFPDSEFDDLLEGG